MSTMISLKRVFYSLIIQQNRNIINFHKIPYKRYNIRLSVLRHLPVIQSSQYSTRPRRRKSEKFEIFHDEEIDPKVTALEHKLLFCEYLERKKVNMEFDKKKKLECDYKYKLRMMRQGELMNGPALSITLKHLQEDTESEKCEKSEEDFMENTPKPIYMPYAETDKYEKVTNPKSKDRIPPQLNEKYKDLYEKYLEAKEASKDENGNEEPSLTMDEFEESQGLEDDSEMKLTDDMSKIPQTWMTDYEEYNDALMDKCKDAIYGTAKPNSKVSSIPCGGCGALLHCKDKAVPGYIPSEIFLACKPNDLKNIICQRCHFLKRYNTALDIKVSPEDYPELMKRIRNKRVAVLLIVDLMDFPCSIWPNMRDIIGEQTPVFVVGNKVDLLPKDSRKFLHNVKECLKKSLEDTGISETNIKHLSLISAKTKYGIEELINKLQNQWKYKGDVYLVGCTNVGKSTLFNTLLSSDYCKTQAIDLVRRATTSPWPGTTLNLLKFPIMNPLDWRLYVRTQRLKMEKEYLREEAKDRKELYLLENDSKHVTLRGHVGMTFKMNKKEVDQEMDLFSIGSRSDGDTKFGLDEKRPEYQHSRWCYDTPGSIQPDQVLHLLTTDELLLTVPKRIISHRTYVLYRNQTLFLAGLGRLDYVSGPSLIKCTVFASKALPVTICRTPDAEDIYRELLHSKAFVVPTNDPKRLKMWPDLKSKELKVTGTNLFTSAADIVLSSAGWIAVTPISKKESTFAAWTPEGRGIYLRNPPLLPLSVRRAGPRKGRTPAFGKGKQIYLL